MSPNPAVDPVPFGHRTQRDEAAQRRSPSTLGLSIWYRPGDFFMTIVLRNFAVACLILCSALANSQPLPLSSSGQYNVDCPPNFKECAKYITENLSNQFLEKYPSHEWKIVVPHALFGRMGNGSIKGNFGISVVPIASVVSTLDLLTNPRARSPKRIFASFKSGADIKAMNNPAFEGDMFDNQRLATAGATLFPVMASEAAAKMVAECSKSPECNIYTP